MAVGIVGLGEWEYSPLPMTTADNFVSVSFLLLAWLLVRDVGVFVCFGR